MAKFTNSGYMRSDRTLAELERVYAILEQNGAEGYTRNNKGDFNLPDATATGKFVYECYCSGKYDYVNLAFRLLREDADIRASYVREVLGLDDGASEGLVTSKVNPLETDLIDLREVVQHVRDSADGNLLMQ